jgi:hypothetical protein
MFKSGNKKSLFIGTVISGILRFLDGIRVCPELQPIPLPKGLLLPNFSVTPAQKINLVCFYRQPLF